MFFKSKFSNLKCTMKKTKRILYFKSVMKNLLGFPNIPNKTGQNGERNRSSCVQMGNMEELKRYGFSR